MQQIVSWEYYSSLFDKVSTGKNIKFNSVKLSLSCRAKISNCNALLANQVFQIRRFQEPLLSLYIFPKYNG